MDEVPIRNAHDRFVRHMLSNRELAASYIRHQLPAEVVEELDLRRLKSAAQSFVDATLHEHLSDLVFEVPLRSGRPALVAILFEHKSYSDPLTPLQVLRYIVRLQEQRLRQGLPPCCVIPMVLYHGDGPWNAPADMAELLGVSPAVQPFVPNFKLPLLDLSRYSDDELREKSVYVAFLSVLKYVRRNDFRERLAEVFEIVSEGLRRDSAMEMLEAILRYVMSAAPSLTPEDIRETFVQGVSRPQLRDEGLSIMPTIAEELIRQGREEGREAGRQQGELIGKIQLLQEILLRPVTSHEELTRLDEPTLEQILAELRSAMDR